MRKRISMFMVGAFIFLMGITKANAEGYLLPDLSGLSISADTAFYSQFLSRGFLRDSDPVMQTGVYAKYKDVKFGVWGSNDLANRDARKSNRVFYLADFTHKIDKISLSLGYDYLDYVGVNARGQEAYVGIGADVFLSPNFTWFYGWADASANNNGGTGYGVLSLAHSIPLGTTPVSLDLSGHIAYNRKYYIKGTSGGDALFTVGLKLPFTKNLVIKPNLDYAIPLGDVRNKKDGNQENKFYAGVNLNYSF
jgi:hypothetical protein